MTTDNQTALRPLTLCLWLTIFFTLFSWIGRLPRSPSALGMWNQRDG